MSQLKRTLAFTLYNLQTIAESQKIVTKYKYRYLAQIVFDYRYNYCNKKVLEYCYIYCNKIVLDYRYNYYLKKVIEYLSNYKHPHFSWFFEPLSPSVIIFCTFDYPLPMDFLISFFEESIIFWGN